MGSPIFKIKCRYCQKCIQYKKRFYNHNLYHRIPKQFDKLFSLNGGFKKPRLACSSNGTYQDKFHQNNDLIMQKEENLSEEQAYLNVCKQVEEILVKEFNKEEFLKQLRNENIKKCIKGIGDLADVAFSVVRFGGSRSARKLISTRNQSKGSKSIEQKQIRVWVEETFKRFIMEQLFDYHSEVLEGCIKSGDRDLGYQYVSYLPDDRKVYALLMKCWAEHGGLEALEEAVEVRAAAGYSPDNISFGLLITTAGQEGNIRQVQRILQYASQIGKRNRYVLNAAIDAFSKTGSFCSAIYLFIELLKKSNAIKLVNQQLFYNNLLQLCPESQRYLIKNRNIFDNNVSENVSGLKKNIAHSRNNSSITDNKNSNSNLKIEFEDRISVEENEDDIICKSNLQVAQLSRFQNQSVQYDAYFFPDAVTFTNLIKCAQNQEQLFWVYELMVELCSKFPQVRANQKTFSVLFSQGSRAGVQDLNWVLERCNDMNVKFKLQINSFVLSALVSCILQIRALKSITLKKLFNLLEKQYDEQDAVVISQMLRLCGHGGMADKIQKVWVTAKKNQQQQNPHVLANLFTAIAANIEDAPFLNKIVQKGQKELEFLLTDFRSQIGNQKEELIFDDVEQSDQKQKSGGYGYRASEQNLQKNKFKRKKSGLDKKDFSSLNDILIAQDFKFQSYAQIRKKVKLETGDQVTTQQQQSKNSVQKQQQQQQKSDTQQQQFKNSDKKQQQQQQKFNMQQQQSINSNKKQQKKSNKPSKKLSSNLSEKVTNQYKNYAQNSVKNLQKQGQILQQLMQPKSVVQEGDVQRQTQQEDPSKESSQKLKGGDVTMCDSSDNQATIKPHIENIKVVTGCIEDSNEDGTTNLYDVNNKFPRLKSGSGLERQLNSLRIVCNALIAVYSKLGDYHSANYIISLMQNCYVRPSLISRNAQLNACARSGDFQLACCLLDCMLAQNEYDSHSFSIVLSACAKSAEPERTQTLFQLMKEMKNMKISVHHYTALIDAHVRSGGAAGIQNAFKTFQDMKDDGITPTATTYGCVLRACERLGDVSKAFTLYLEASDLGVLPSDECHNMLINVCTKANRLEEALELIKALVRGKGHMQVHTINSLTRALCENYPDRAVRMLRLMHSKKIETQRETYLALVSACSNFGKAQIALDLYVEMRQSGYLSDCGPMSRLVCGLCRADNLSGLGLVLEDQIRLADGETEFPISISLQGGSDGEDETEEYESYEVAYTQKLVMQDTNDLPWTYKWLQQDGQIDVCQQMSHLFLQICRMHLQDDSNTDIVHNKATVPDMEGMAAILIVVAKNNLLETCRIAYQVSKQLYPRDFALCTINNRSMFEGIISMSCRMNDLAFGLDVFDDWKSACVDVSLNSKMGNLTSFIGNAFQPPKLSNATLAYLESCCRSRSEFEWRVYDVCAAMRQQRESFKQAQLIFPTKLSHHFKDLVPQEAATHARD